MSFPPMPLLTISSLETITACHSFPIEPSDIFICSYPKSGTTWTQHIVLSLILADRRYNCDARGDEISYEHVSDFAPFFEIDAHWDLRSNRLVESVRNNHDRLKRRIFNTHLRWEMLPKQTEQEQNDPAQQKSSERKCLRPSCGKFIYITRNLVDVCASFYHHLSNQKEGTYTQSFDTFARDWMSGKVAFGSPLHHLLSFAEGFSDNNYSSDQYSKYNDVRPLLLLSYEDMKSNLRQQVLRIIHFLHLHNIPMDVLDKEILPTFEFQSMKDSAQRFQPKSVTWLNGYQFLRKGVVGDGKQLMENELSLTEVYEEWVKNEQYKERVEELLGCSVSGRSDNAESENRRIRDVFLGVVDAP